MHKFVWSFAWLCVCSVVTPTYCQEKVYTPHIPKDAVGHVTLRVKQIYEMEKLKLAPWEIATAAGLDAWGFDPLKIDKVEIIVGIPKRPPLDLCFIVTTIEDVNPEQVKPPEVLARENMSMVFASKRQALIGQYEYIKRVLDEPPVDSELSRQVARIGTQGVASAVFVMAPIRAQFESGIGELPPQFQADAKTLIAKTQMVATRIELDKNLSMPIVLETATAEDAQAVNQSLLSLSKTAYAELSRAEELNALGTPVAKAAAAYEKRYVAEVIRLLTPTVTGNRLLVRLDQKALQTFQSANLLPAVITGAVTTQRGAR